MSEALILVAIERAKERKKLNEELAGLAHIYVKGGDCREQMESVLSRLNAIGKVNANDSVPVN